MLKIDRRSLLYLFGVASITPLLSADAATTRPVLARPGENRYPFGSAAQAKRTPCKLTGEESGGACSIFEMNVFPRSGPSLHVHHREDECYYVLTGEFLFKVGGVDYHLLPGACIWAPREIPHVWANTSQTEGKMILTCIPGGFEKFFDELGNVPADKLSMDTMKAIMAKYGMDLLGPPLLGWTQTH